MTYWVTVEVGTPEGAVGLDELQREGAASLLAKGLESVEAIDGPDGVEVEVADCFVGAHPEGVLLGVSVDAPALEFAEDAVRAVVTDLLEQNEPLAEWQISKCAVDLHPELAQRSLEAAGGEDAPPADPKERARRHAEARKPVDTPQLDPAEIEAMRGKIGGLAPRLKAFPVECFGYSDDEEERIVSRDDAELAAGALVYASEILVDELFQDVVTLHEESGTSVADSDGVFMVLEQLPPAYAHLYTALFAKRLTVAAVSMIEKFTRTDHAELSCVAEELLLRLLLDEALVVVDINGLLSEEIKVAWECFADQVYEDTDHEWLYQPAMDGTDEEPSLAHLGTAPMGAKDWFTPFDDRGYVHPFAAAEADGDTT
ncbi:hypothetical protein FH609_020350 [Streptomyces sp. 3MP-14]|uniref:Uncharacterized protein n=1 Tax=Streptomyces mimosae TaxID=2586635 RepID=A0A5N6A1P1_9ACTN|nr:MULTISPECIES: hypothetical protein [Streptomyces]KAB8161796.1 hypothetical protein FH607_024070 [Streptomyces mimosae]KAB8174936.1 hypothetical protein FH609_020350 [Streptomyces sp. 3MP-14]